MLQLTKSPTVAGGLLIRRPPHDVLEALADPSITTRFGSTKSSGRMIEGAELTWQWERYAASGRVWVRDLEADRRSRFAWEGYDPSHPSTVEVLVLSYDNAFGHLRITEAGFRGDTDARVSLDPPNRVEVKAG